MDDGRTALSIDIEMKAMNNVILHELFLVEASGKAKRIVEARHVQIRVAARRHRDRRHPMRTPATTPPAGSRSGMEID